MAGGAVIWRAGAVLKAVEARVSRGLDRAALLVLRDVRQNFGSPPPMPTPAPRVKGKKMTAKKWRSSHHSKPNEPPFVQTGTLKRSIAVDKPGPMVRRVGSSLKPGDYLKRVGKKFVLAHGGPGKRSYAHCLEYGTSKMAARPYLRPALKRQQAAIMRELTRA